MDGAGWAQTAAMTGWSFPDRLRADVRSCDPAVRSAAIDELRSLVAVGEQARAELKRVTASGVPEAAAARGSGLLGAVDARTATFERVRWREGYDIEQVDEFLALVGDVLERSPGALTPQDVDAKRFAATKFREGYDQDQVDAFLDRVVDTLKVLQPPAPKPRS